MARAAKARSKDNKFIRYSFYFLALFFIAVTVYYLYLFSQGLVSLDFANTVTSISISMLFSTIVVAYLFLKGMAPDEILHALGLSRDKLNKNAVWIALKLFLLILILEWITGAISQATGIQLPTNVAQVLGGQPLYFLLFAVFISPINEEIFFRGFLVPRVGIIFSAILFAILHFGYGSISEFAAALLFGLAAGYYFKKYGSLYATIFAHFGVNLLTIAILILFGAGAVS